MVQTPAEDDARPMQQHAIDQAMRQEALGALARKISHDFNNILQVLSGRLELIEQVPGLPQVVHEDLRSAQTGVEMAYRLLRQLRAFVLVDDLPTELLLADRLAQSALDLARPLLPASVQLELTISEPGLQLRVNRTLVEGVLIELLDNAAEACGDQPCRIEIQVARGQRESTSSGHTTTHSYALLRVRDSGPGFSEPDQTKIFDVFYTTKGERRGAGMAIARNVARTFDGSLELDSQPGQSAQLTMWLPLAE
jgi:signal transduction histidine kinase